MLRRTPYSKNRGAFIGGNVRHASDPAGEALWRFSLALYARPGVAAALIALQDRSGFDVNLMLFALWAGAVHNRRLARDDLVAAAAAADPVRSGAVAPLRQLRRALRDDLAADTRALRRRVLALELAAERAAQQRLAAWLCATTQDGSEAESPELAEANFALYLGAAAGSTEAAVVRAAFRALARRA